MSSSPGAEGAGFVPSNVGSREALEHPPQWRLRKRPARLLRESQVLAPRDLGLIHENAFDAHRMLRMLGRLALSFRASHLELAARDADHDRAVLLAPELFAALRVPPERTQPVGRSGGVLQESERETGLVSFPDPRD